MLRSLVCRSACAVLLVAAILPLAALSVWFSADLRSSFCYSPSPCWPA